MTYNRCVAKISASAPEYRDPYLVFISAHRTRKHGEARRHFGTGRTYSLVVTLPPGFIQ